MIDPEKDEVDQERETEQPEGFREESCWEDWIDTGGEGGEGS